MPKNPKKLGTFKCGPYTWTEYLVPYGHPKLVVEGEWLAWGVTNTLKKEIYLCSLLEGEDFEVLKIHERMHAIWYSYLGQGIASDELEESIVEALSRGMNQIQQTEGKRDGRARNSRKN